MCPCTLVHAAAGWSAARSSPHSRAEVPQQLQHTGVAPFRRRSRVASLTRASDMAHHLHLGHYILAKPGPPAVRQCSSAPVQDFLHRLSAAVADIPCKRALDNEIRYGSWGTQAPTFLKRALRLAMARKHIHKWMPPLTLRESSVCRSKSRSLSRASRTAASRKHRTFSLAFGKQQVRSMVPQIRL